MNQASPTASDDMVRKAAFSLLREALSLERGEDGEWTEHKDFLKLTPQQRGSCLHLTLTTLRHLGSIDALIARRMTREPKGAHRAVLHVLRLGVTELLWLNTPAYAAVNSYVELTKKLDFHALSGMVNAILKRISETGARELAALDMAKLDMPAWIWQRWAKAYGEEAVRHIAAIHAQEPPLDISVKGAPQNWAEALEATALPTGSLRRMKAGRIPDLPGFAEGAWWVQDAAAALPVKLMGTLTGKRVLDMCAAPGGKTAQACAAGAHVTALERSPARALRLAHNLERLKLEATIIEGDAHDYATSNTFDAVLLDAPCTATGTLRRHPEIAWKRTPQDIERLGRIQHSLLAHAAQLTSPGGLLVYATCSLEPEEGEERIRQFVKEYPYFTVVPADTSALGIPTDWVNTEGMLRILPCHWQERGGMDGFFAAALRKGD